MISSGGAHTHIYIYVHFKIVGVLNIQRTEDKDQSARRKYQEDLNSYIIFVTTVYYYCCCCCCYYYYCYYYHEI